MAAGLSIFGAVFRKWKRRRTKGFFSGFISWWHRRKFYADLMDPHHPPRASHDEEEDVFEWKNASDELQEQPHDVRPSTPLVTKQETALGRSRTHESIQSVQDSIMSIDSLAESQWDPEDEASNCTPLAANVSHTSEFFREHVRFLKVQTNAQKVEEGFAK